MPVRKTMQRRRARVSSSDFARTRALLVDFEIVTAIVPVREHEAFARTAVDHRIVPRGSMRVAVDHPCDTRAAERALDRATVDVEYRFRLSCRRESALAAEVAADPATNEIGQPEEPALIRGIAIKRSIALIGDVVGAEFVAVRQQRFFPADGDDRLLGQ